MRLLPRIDLRAAVLLLAALGACRSGNQTATTSTGAGSGGAGGGGDAGGAGGALLPGTRIAVLDWNTHDFFDNVENGTEPVSGTTDYHKKVQTIGGVIASMDPDVVMLAEIENEGVLTELDTLALGGKYVNTTLIPANDPRGINIGLLSKIAPDSVVSHKDDTFTKLGTPGPSYKYSRDCLEVHLTVNGRKLVLLGVHFKAKAPPDDPDKRLAEAQHTRAIADGLTAKDPALAVLVLGDYNDETGSAPVAAVAGKAPALFTDAAAQVQTALRYSYTFNGARELIDHQLANPLLAGMLDKSSVVIKHGAGIDDDSAYSSDHAPVFAVYQIH